MKKVFCVVVFLLMTVGCQRLQEVPISWTWLESGHISVADFCREPVNRVYPVEDNMILARVRQEWDDQHPNDHLIGVQVVFVDGTSEALPLRMREVIFHWE